MRTGSKAVLFGLLWVALANCTIKASTGAGDNECVPGEALKCACSVGTVGERVCNSAGTAFGVCVCGTTTTTGTGATGSGTTTVGTTVTGTGSATTGSTTTGASGGGGAGGMASTGSGGSAGVSVDAGASDGAGGSSVGAGGTSGGSAGYWDGGSDAKVDSGGPMLDPCDACTQSQCASELDACLSDSSCFEGDGSGQYEQVIACVDATRVSQVVKRQDFIDCGNEVGLSGTGWPPVGMTTETTNLMNCIAMGQPNNNSWADSTMRSTVWPTNSCAKLACTAKLQ